MNCNNTRCSTCSQVKTSVLIFSFLFSYFNARAREFSGNSRFLSQLKSFYSLCQNTCQLRLYGTIHFVFFFFFFFFLCLLRPRAFDIACIAWQILKK